MSFHRRLANPIMRRLGGRLPGQAVLETIGRASGLPRRTPVGGRLDGCTFWLVSDHGRQSNYVRNIEANPRVRLQLGGRWRSGVAEVRPGDDARARLKTLPRTNSLLVCMLGTDLLTVRVTLDAQGIQPPSGSHPI